MKIIYEPGDYATVEDNIDAGPAAAERVKLLFKKGNGKWLCTIVDSDSPALVEEIYLNP